jgi:hypothetical protein
VSERHGQSVVTLADNPRTDPEPDGGAGGERRSSSTRQGDWFDRLRPFIFLYVMLIFAAVILVEIRAVRDSRPRETTGVSLTAPMSGAVATNPPANPRADVIISGRPSATATEPILATTATVQPTLVPTVPPTPTPIATPLPAPTLAAPSLSSQPTVRIQDAVAFAQGSSQGVTVDLTDALSLVPTVSDDYDSPTIDSARWQVVPWGAGGTVTVRDGMATANIAALRSRRAFVHRTLEARLRFTAGAQPFQNLAWSADLNGATAILIGKPQADSGHLYARVKHEGEVDRLVQLPVSLEDGEYHTYGIVWGASRVDFTVDGVLRATIPITLDTPMFAWISAASAQPLVADWARILDYGEVTGTFTARPIDAGVRTLWQTVTIRGTVSAGTQVRLQTRTSADGVTWSLYAVVDDRGAIASPPGRYLQYTIAIDGTVSSSPAIAALTLTFLPASASG